MRGPTCSDVGERSGVAGMNDGPKWGGHWNHIYDANGWELLKLVRLTPRSLFSCTFPPLRCRPAAAQVELPENHPWAEKKEVSQDEVEKIKARLAAQTRRGAGLSRGGKGDVDDN